MIKAKPLTRLQSLVERIEKLEEERKAVGGDVRDVYAEAKSAGYDVPTMRRLVAWRKLDAADRAEREALDDTYRHALGMAVDLVSNGEVSLREAAAATGVSKSSIHRALAVPALSREMVAEDLGRIESHDGPMAIRNGGGGHESGPVMGPAEVARAAPPADVRTFDEIVGPLPDRLRRAST